MHHIGKQHLRNESGLGQEDVTFSSLFKNFLDGVSVVGLKYVVSPGHVFRKLFWLMMVLFGVGFMLYQVVDR